MNRPTPPLCDVFAGERRVSELEREVAVLRTQMAADRRARRSYVLACLLLVGIVGAAGQSASQPAARPDQTLKADTVVAQRFFLTTPDGNRRGAFTVLPDGTTALLMSDPHRKAAAGLTVGLHGGASLVLSDRDGKTRLDFNIEPDGTPHASLLDRHERKRIDLAILADIPQLELLDKRSNRRVRLAVEADDWARMQLLDNVDRPRITLMSRPDDAGGVFLIDKDGASRVSLLNKGSGDPILSLHDREMKTIWKAP